VEIGKNYERFAATTKSKFLSFTAGDQHGLDKGVRTGFGYGIEKTLKGLARVEALMRSLK